MIEVMVVGLMMAGAVVAMSTMDVPTRGRPAEDIVGDQQHVCSFVETYSMMPVVNDTVRFSSQLDEWAVQGLIGQGDPIRQRIQAEWLTAGSQLVYQHENDQLVVHGPDTLPSGPNQVCTQTHQALWGTTLIRPGMSHYGPDQVIDLQLLPIDAGGALGQSGMPYHVTVQLSDDDGDTYTQYAYGHVRTQGDQPLSPINLTFQNAAGTTIQKTSVNDLIPRLDEALNVWQIHVNLTNDQASANEVWWKDHLLRMEAPPGWTLETITPEADWQHIPTPSDAPDAPHRFQYTGNQAQGPAAGISATVNLTRDMLDDVDNAQVVSVWTEGERTSNNHLVMNPTVALYEQPFGVYTSRSEPWTTSEHAPFRVHVVNPRGEDYNVNKITVEFPEHAHQLSRLHIPSLLAEGWTMTRESATSMVFTWERGLPLSSGDSLVAEFPVKIKQPEGTAMHVFEAPVLSLLDEDGGMLSSVVGKPMGRPGQYSATLPPGLLADGEHSVAVQDAGRGGSPPGRETYTVGGLGAATLEEVQTARYTMGLESWPRVHDADESVDLAIETGTMLSTLRSLDAVDPDSVRINVTATDLWGYLTEDYLAQDEFPLELDMGSQVMGIEFLDVNGAGALDLVVTYRDGHVMALDGDEPDSTRLWRENLDGSVSGVPVLLEVDPDSPGLELVVPLSRNGVQWFAVLNADGIEVETVPVAAYASHLVAGTCQEGVWFMASDTDRANGETLVAETGFFGQPPSSTRLGFWAPGEEPVYGDDWHQVNPFAVLEGRFGPFGACGVVQAVGVNLESEPRVVLSRLDVDDLGSELWRFEGEGLMRGIWARDTATTPLEVPGAWGDGAVLDELVLVTDEHGLEVLSGWGAHGRPVTRTFDEVLPPADRLLGLSWVDHDTGYVVSLRGWLWKTEDAGATWEKVQETPIVDAPRTLTGFVFGGNGEALFENDEGWVGHYGGGAITFTDSFDADFEYKGLAFTSDRPGVIGFHRTLDVTGIFEWEGGENGGPADDPVLAIPCECSEPVGHDQALVGIGDGKIYVGTPVANRIVELAATAVSAQRDGSVLAFDGTDLIYNTTTDETLFHDIDIPNGASVAARAHPGSADLTYGTNHYSLSGGSLVKQTVTTDALVNVSAGNGARWLVTETSIIRSEVSGSYWFAVDPGEDVAEDDVVSVRRPVDARVGGYELHTPSGAIHALPATVSWEPGSLLEYSVPDATVPPTGAGIGLDIAGDFGAVTLEAATDQSCAACLVPVGWPDAVLYADGVWGDADGTLPRLLLPDIGPAPVMVDRVVGAPLVASGTLEDGIRSWSVDSGVTLGVIDSDELDGPLGDVERLVLGVAERSGMDDVLWAEAGTDPVGVGGTGLLLNEALRGDVVPKLARLDPISGDVLCVAEWPETDRIGARLLVAKPEAPSLLYSGTGMGRLGATLPGSCDKDWEQAVSDTGSRIVLSVSPADRNWYGARIYLVDVIVDIDLVGETRIQLMDYSVQSDLDFPRAEVWYNANLYLWDWNNIR